MDDSSIDLEKARGLGYDVATVSHDALPADRIEEIAALTEDITASFETDSTEAAAEGLLNFWTGHVAGNLKSDGEPADFEPTEQFFENGFKSGNLGVDLYQALDKTTKATRGGSDTPDLSGWTERLLELTNRHVAHLKSHGDHAEV